MCYIELRPILSQERSMRILYSIVTFLGFLASSVLAADKPNIIVILMDDVGVGDLGFSGGEDFQTPNMDRLANEGCIFSNAYANPMCAPTRAAML